MKPFILAVCLIASFAFSTNSFSQTQKSIAGTYIGRLINPKGIALDKAMKKELKHILILKADGNAFYKVRAVREPNNPFFAMNDVTTTYRVEGNNIFFQDNEIPLTINSNGTIRMETNNKIHYILFTKSK